MRNDYRTTNCKILGVNYHPLKWMACSYAKSRATIGRLTAACSAWTCHAKRLFHVHRLTLVGQSALPPILEAWNVP